MSYGEILKSIMKHNPAVVALTAEARKALGTIPDEFPDRFYDFGIAEQNLVGAACGLAAMGKIPVIHVPLAAFVTMRPFEFIRTSAAMQDRNVKIPGLLPGFAAAFQGPTHVALEDISLMRGIPGMTVMEASCEADLKEVMEHAFAVKGCVYFRVPAEMPERFDYCEKVKRIDQPRLLKKGKKGLIFTSGTMTAIVLSTVEMLAKEGLDLTLANLCVLDPAPAGELAVLMAEFKKVATVEEHFITGGLGSIIAEIIAQEGLGVKLRRVGLDDAFPDRYASRSELLPYLGLDAKGIAAKLNKYFGHGSKQGYSLVGPSLANGRIKTGTRLARPLQPEPEFSRN
jgi:transketolase